MQVNKIFSIKGKKCVITGGSGGIGFTLAKLLKKNGAKVIIIDKKIKKKN